MEFDPEGDDFVLILDGGGRVGTNGLGGGTVKDIDTEGLGGGTVKQADE